MARSAAYHLFHRAMAERRPVACLYNGHARALCPIILGHSDGAEKALVWQFAGDAEHGRVPGWKCLILSEVANATLVDAPWHEAPGQHSGPQSCVKEVDLDVNPASPYAPKRRLRR